MSEVNSSDPSKPRTRAKLGSMLGGFAPFGLSLLVCALVPLGLSLILHSPTLKQGKTALGRYGPWTPEEMAHIGGAYEQIQAHRRTPSKVELGGIDWPTLVHALLYKPMPESPGLVTYPSIVHTLISSRLPDVEAVLMSGPMRDRDMTCELVDPHWTESASLVPALCQAMRDGSAQATFKLRKFSLRAEAVPALKAMLLDPECNADAAGVLFSMGHDAIPTLTQGLYDDHESVRAKVAAPLVALISMEPTEAHGEYTLVLAKVLSDASLDANSGYQYGATPPRFMALNCLGILAMKDEQAVAAIARALADSNRDVSTSSSAILENLGEAGRAAVPALVKAMSDDRGGVRTAAANAFVALAAVSRAWLPAVQKLLLAREFDKRFTAAYALSHFGADGAPAMPILIEALRKPDAAGVRKPSIDAILRMPECTPPYLPGIRRLLQSPDPNVRTSAAMIIRRLDRLGHSK